MGKDKKKKASGAGAAKAEKKLEKKVNKESQKRSKDEDAALDNLLKAFKDRDAASGASASAKCTFQPNAPPPSPRASVSLCPHPEKDDLYMFGGEFNNGKNVTYYNDLYVYHIPSNKWSVQATGPRPTPRSAHQALFVPLQGGQMFVFGGEFANSDETQYYQFRDLWIYHSGEERWEKMGVAPSPGNRGATPSPRSGHRMVLQRNQLIIFGGFQDSSTKGLKYLNELLVFDIPSRQWVTSTLTVSGIPPSPRSGCVMTPAPNGDVIVFMGYSTLKQNGAEKGKVWDDMLTLRRDARDHKKWQWKATRVKGFVPPARSGASCAWELGNRRAVLYGGAIDTIEDEEDIRSQFLSDLYSWDLEGNTFSQILLRSHQERRRRKKKDEGEEDEMEGVEEEESGLADKVQEMKVTSDDGVFTVTVGPSLQPTAGASSAVVVVGEESKLVTSATGDQGDGEYFWPHARMGAALALKSGVLYIYGGIYEKESGAQVTFQDMYALDLQRPVKWRILLEQPKEEMEWLESDEEEDGESGSEEEEDEEEESDMEETEEGAELAGGESS